MTLNNKIVKCTVCQNQAYFYKKLKEVTLYYCDFCRHRFTDINSIKVKESYSNEYFNDSHKNYFENKNLKLFDYIYNAIKSNKSNSCSVLDVCCGQGDLLKYLRKKSSTMKLSGIDYHQNKSENNIKFLCGDIFNNKFDEKYDVIVNLAAIEHVWNVQDYTLLLKNLSKDNGIIISNTINDSSIVYIAARVIYKFGLKIPMERLYDKHHLNHFSNNSLEYLHKKNSLNIIEKPYIEWPMNAVDLPKNNLLMKIIYKLALYVLFICEKISGKGILQTILAKKI